MKLTKPLAAIVFLFTIGFAMFQLQKHADSPDVVAQGSVLLSDKLGLDLDEYPYLFIALYAAGNHSRPIAAARFTVHGIAERGGTVRSFVLTKSNLQVMDPQASWPTSFVATARLQRSQNVTRGQKSNLRGKSQAFAFGAKDLEIVIHSEKESTHS